MHDAGARSGSPRDRLPTYQSSLPHLRESQVQKRREPAEKGGQACSAQSCTTLLLSPLRPAFRVHQAAVESTHKHRNS